MTTISLESYPPIFRQPKPSPEILNSGESNVVVSDPIPCIDLRSLVERDVEGMARLGEACRDWGVFRLVNHGIPMTLLSQLQERTRDLLSLSFEAKNDMFSAKPLSYFWGTPALTPSGTSLSTGSNINWVEGLSVNVSQLSQIQLPHNNHHVALASYRRVLEEYGEHLGRLGTAIFKAMLNNLDKIGHATESKANLYCESTGLLRIYRYPPKMSSEAGGGSSSWGMDVHTDSSILSVLSQDQVGGLEVFKDDQWFSVKPRSNTLIVNLGDMMQAISNDRYKSVQHRVRANKGKERVSICYFVFPGEGRVIKSSRYRPFTYTDFQAQVQRDIKTLGYKVGLPRFKHI